MPKITLTEKKVDPLLTKLGKSKSIDYYGLGKSRLVNNKSPQLMVTFLNSSTSQQGFLLSEVTKLKITSINNASNFKSLVRSSMELNKDITNHYVTMEKTQKSIELSAAGLNTSIASYDISTNFNYLSQDYDELLTATPEIDLLSILTLKSKRDYLSFRKNNKLAPINYSQDSLRMTNFVLPNTGPKRRKDLNSSKILNERPYYNEIKITNKVTNNFTNFINEIDAFDALLNAYLKLKKNLLPFNVQMNDAVTEKKIESFDLLTWVNSDDFSISNDVFPLDPSSVENSKMITDYKKLLFTGYIRSLSKGNFRSFQQIYNNEECYKEDFVYSLDKYRDVVVEPKVQTLYVPAVDDTSLLNDTQVKYGQTYVYKCKAHYIIVGNKYRYSNLQFFQTKGEPQYATVDVTNVPSVVVVPFDMFTETVKILMPPPLFPQIKFVTENNSSNQIQIYLSPTKGEKIDNFIKILRSDTIQENDMSMNSMEKEGKIRFKTIPGSGLYEIFKTETPPKSYEDFRDRKLSEIRMPFESNSAIFNDTVIPNSKYYYLFRKVNAKGLVSNPTAIYEVELVKDADDSKILVTEYDFPKKILSQDSRKFKSLFQVFPSTDQTWFDEQQSILWNKSTIKGTVDNLSLGIANKSVWGRKFKIRIKSTTSGKIIDYNVTFRLTKNKTEEDF